VWQLGREEERRIVVFEMSKHGESAFFHSKIQREKKKKKSKKGLKRKYSLKE
jgi:hypothetical protein